MSIVAGYLMELEGRLQFLKQRLRFDGTEKIQQDFFGSNEITNRNLVWGQ